MALVFAHCGMRFTSFALARPFGNGFLDHLDLDPSGIIRIAGWLKGPVEPKIIPAVHLDREDVPFLEHYRLSRPDVEPLPGMNSVFQPGFVFEYLLPESLSWREFESISITGPKSLNARFEGRFAFVAPHYRALLDSREVYHRDRIYGSGPPNPAVHPDILALAKKLPDPVLDFGCGSGALVVELQSAGIEAHGLELDTDVIVRSIRPESKNLVTLYDGRFPSPFPARKFRSVFCSEVLEHIPDFQGAIREVARLAASRVVFTVPDASAIPLGFRHGLTPWHLLEATHVNFFNQNSLRAALEPCFRQITFGRVCQCTFNDSPFYVSLVADCSN